MIGPTLEAASRQMSEPQSIGAVGGDKHDRQRLSAKDAVIAQAGRGPDGFGPRRASQEGDGAAEHQGGFRAREPRNGLDNSMSVLEPIEQVEEEFAERCSLAGVHLRLLKSPVDDVRRVDESFLTDAEPGEADGIGRRLFPKHELGPSERPGGEEGVAQQRVEPFRGSAAPAGMVAMNDGVLAAMVGEGDAGGEASSAHVPGTLADDAIDRLASRGEVAAAKLAFCQQQKQRGLIRPLEEALEDDGFRAVEIALLHEPPDDQTPGVEAAGQPGEEPFEFVVVAAGKTGGKAQDSGGFAAFAADFGVSGVRSKAVLAIGHAACPRCW